MNRSIILFSVLTLAIGAGTLYILQVDSDRESIPDSGLDDSKFKFLLGKLEAYEREESKWSKPPYNRMLHLLNEQVGDSKEQKAEQLYQRLNSHYLNLLSDTVKSFCVFGSKWGTMEALKKEVESFKESNPQDIELMQIHLKNCRSSFSIGYSVRRYTKDQAFSNSRTKSFRNQFDDLITTDLVSDNEYFLKKWNEASRLLQRHRNAAIDHVEKARELCDCEKEFAGFTYYVDECQRIKEAYIEELKRQDEKGQDEK